VVAWETPDSNMDGVFDQGKRCPRRSPGICRLSAAQAVHSDSVRDHLLGIVKSLDSGHRLCSIPGRSSASKPSYRFLAARGPRPWTRRSANSSAPPTGATPRRRATRHRRARAASRRSRAHPRHHQPHRVAGRANGAPGFPEAFASGVSGFAAGFRSIIMRQVRFHGQRLGGSPSNAHISRSAST
jgi:hypothetical protein